MFQEKLINLINEEGLDADYNMSDRVLATYIMNCLEALDEARREQDDIEGVEMPTPTVSAVCKYCSQKGSDHTDWCPTKELT